MKQSHSAGGWGRAGETRERSRERGQTLFLVVISLAALIAMAVLSIDITNLYLAHSEAEKAADAAALAGAKAFVSSGFTSGGLGAPDSAAAQSLVCNGNSGLADLQARAEAGQNKIGGTAPSTVTTACNLGTPENPQISVSVVRTGLPTFFSRIFQRGPGQVSASAKAEAYNPSGQDLPVRVASVKPWLIANCDYGATSGRRGNRNPNCPGGAGYFLDPNNNYSVANRGRFIGQTLKLQQLTLGALPVSLANSYYTLTTPLGALSCPAASAVSCSAVNAASPDYFESVACANSIPLTCGSSVDQGMSVYPLGGVLLSPPHAAEATMCMIHANDFGDDQGQDRFNVTARGTPITIDGGANNPNAALRGTTNISRSDSVVTLPIWDGNGICGASGLCGAFNIVGFMQLGVQRIQPGLLGASEIDGVILNVAGCGDSGGTGTTAVSGGAIAPIPVRLIQ